MSFTEWERSIHGWRGGILFNSFWNGRIQENRYKNRTKEWRNGHRSENWLLRGEKWPPQWNRETTVEIYTAVESFQWFSQFPAVSVFFRNCSSKSLAKITLVENVFLFTLLPFSICCLFQPLSMLTFVLSVFSKFLEELCRKCFSLRLITLCIRSIFFVPSLRKILSRLIP